MKRWWAVDKKWREAGGLADKKQKRADEKLVSLLVEMSSGSEVVGEGGWWKIGSS